MASTYLVDLKELPIIETGPVDEYFVDFMGLVRVTGPNFWVTFGSILVPAGMASEAIIPKVRIGRALETYKPNELAGLITRAKHQTLVIGPRCH